MSVLFEPARIGTLELENRFVRSATWEGMCGPSGEPTEKLQALYRGLVEGGVGLLITGYTFVSPEGRQLPGKMGLHSDDLVPAHRDLVGSVHEKGGKVAVQLVHAGGQANRKSSGMTPIAPSAVEFPTFAEVPKEMTKEDIARVVSDFGAAARRAKEAGYDAVQLHGAHGYLINQFLSPLTNRRKDEYGGSLENRARFLLEVVSAVRDAVGTDYPVFIKLNGHDFLDGGFTIDEAVVVAKWLEEAGVDAIEVSGGSAASKEFTPARKGINSREKEGYHRDLARRVKEAVSIPVLVVGGFRSFDVMEETVRSGDADFISLSRPLIREPHLVSRFREGARERATCISCSGCFLPGIKEGGIYCVVEAKSS
ncbi:MAG: NADH:flavin oxidoreductase [Deltaproteobacteria bacterium]|nr:MAG: NADH:flavin oxidoreductase [Deltaproteobacteria bacterium]